MRWILALVAATAFVAASAPAWSPDGRWIVFGRGKPRASLFLIPAAGGKARLLVSAPGISFDQPDWQRLP